MGHKALTSKSEFDAALATAGKFVLIFAYSGEIPPGAEQAATDHATTTDAYSVDIDAYPAAKEYFGVTEPPTVILYKDGKELKKVPGMTKDKSAEIMDMLK
ncbi:hypothetical protein K402DRAFT_400606 [Aulographum hederae CBS 113979]|uniref:Thioredoxin domain-containing protein n=1 Tax=Aulographum hederae CBS 113979 TaxID=1176131 RepID=A0A6G1HD20_9PEZI|nr:hypothetical protein K402DRAFT_400606 [Aulographum hederae CBS 113979]